MKSSRSLGTSSLRASFSGSVIRSLDLPLLSWQVRLADVNKQSINPLTPTVAIWVQL